MSQGDDAVAFCRAQIGKPYVWGTTGPNTYDCSGLVYRAYRSISPPVYLGRTTYEQIFDGKEVSVNELAVGDLVFPYSDISHVQIYAGGGRVIEAPNKDIPVRETELTTVWRARRVGTVSGAAGETDIPPSILASIGAAIGAIPNPIEAGIEAKETAQNAGKIVRLLASKKFWLQAGTTMVGFTIVVGGILFLNRGLMFQAINTVRQVGKDALGGALQGFTFGAGASATGGLGLGGTTTRTAIEGNSRPISGVPVSPSPDYRPARVGDPDWLVRGGALYEGSYARMGRPNVRVPRHRHPVSRGGTITPGV